MGEAKLSSLPQNYNLHSSPRLGWASTINGQHQYDMFTISHDASGRLAKTFSRRYLSDSRELNFPP